MLESTDVNLATIQMGDLGPLVVIAGRNGAGKSRLLRKVIQWTRNPPNLAALQRQISKLEQIIKGNPAHPNNDAFRKQLAEVQKGVAERNRLTLSVDEPPQIVPFVPTQLDLADPNQMSKANLLQSAKDTEQPGIQHLSAGTFAKLQAVQDRKWEATHPESTLTKREIALAVAEFDHLDALLSQFLGTRVTRSVDGEACLFGLPLGKTGLSDGQKVVLQLCIAIHAQGATLNNLIIFMDEPENHLHPAALLDLIEAVREHLKDGQLWIATHSIPLLAAVDPSAIWWMENNMISKAGSTPEKVLAGLLGNEERRDQLASFLDLPFTLASVRFAAECLASPRVVAHRSGDPQTQQMGQVLNGLRAKLGKLRILDFGAGKGRLAAELAESWSQEDRRRLEYVAFDVSPTDAAAATAAIARLQGDAGKRLFHDATTLRAVYDKGSFDVVVMCNVLHEIQPAAWDELFGPTGKISELLRGGGFLLLVEVQTLPYGEKAHQNGFIVLDTAQLKELFSIKEKDSAQFLIDERRDGWLKAHLIGQPLLTRYTPTTRAAALRDLASTARDRIRELRDGDSDYRRGRLHGFWLQQFANAQLA